MTWPKNMSEKIALMPPVTRFKPRAKHAVLVLLLCCMALARSFAWGVQGHEVIADLAWQGLQPMARQEVARLLALEPGQTLGSIASWADVTRSVSTSAWHYVNFPRGTCSYVPQRDCSDGNCVVAAIEQQRDIFASNASDADRLRALKYLVHFVGDVHQPLHAGYADDRGGNQFQLRILMRGSNLHALWVSGLLHQMDLDNATLESVLQSLVPTQDGLDLRAQQMAQESCRIVAMPDFYPVDGVNVAYVQRFTPVLQRRLALAGARLAGILNAATAAAAATGTGTGTGTGTALTAPTAVDSVPAPATAVGSKAR
jgi:hypothetical protein